MTDHKHIKDCKSKFAISQRESMSIDACEGVSTSELQHGVLKSYKQALEDIVEKYKNSSQNADPNLETYLYDIAQEALKESGE